MGARLGLQVLVFESNAESRALVVDGLRGVGCQVEVSLSMHALKAALRNRDIDAVVVGVGPPAATSFVETLLPLCSETDVVVLAEQGCVADAVAAVRAGATDYFIQPLDLALLVHSLARVAERRQLQRQVATARADLLRDVFGPAIIGRSKSMAQLFERLDRMAKANASVLIRGESGTGKELVARLLHQRSPRAEQPFVAVNCAAFPETLLEAELFGHERGAFTGAQKRRVGRFQMAHRGTLFLDEVAEIPLSGQAKLLRVLQEGIVEPLGSDQAVPVDVRVLSATHRDLKARIQEGLFREDLFFRLKVLECKIPPLRDRGGDIPLLVQHFLRRFSTREPLPKLTTRAWERLGHYGFPGNVRELEHAVQHAVVLADDVIDLAHLPEEIAGDEAVDFDEERAFATLAEATREFERTYLIGALHLAEGSRTKTAELLGISRKNLWEKLKSHGLDKVPTRGAVAQG